MIAERPGGVSPGEPGRNTPDTKAQREARQRVEKVREIDPDEETKRREKRFKALMGDEDQPVSMDPNRAPSPFETTFHATPKVSASDDDVSMGSSYNSNLGSNVEDAVVPSPAYSPPPDVQATPPEPETDISDALPQSNHFWTDTDLPTEAPAAPQLKETQQSINRTHSSSSDPSSAGKIGQGTKGISSSVEPSTKPGKSAASPFGIPGKPVSQKKPKDEDVTPPFFGQVPEKPNFGTDKNLPAKGKQGKFADDDETPQARYLSQEEEMEPRSNQAAPFDQEKEARQGASDKPKAKEKGVPKGSDERRSELAPYYARQREDDKEGTKEKQRDVAQIQPPSSTPLPQPIQPIAQAAAMQAAPYISPETIPLFYQMVGTMYIMSTPTGINRTEIVLNSPNFANSKFFGSTITIEKYTTAPDSFNIRLTGSNAAVVAFRENIPSLMTAFQNGNFNFRVNRLDAEFSIERPVFRRKDQEGGKDMGGEMGERRK